MTNHRFATTYTRHFFFPSLTPPVVFVYHTTFFWHFLFVETISFIVLWKFATEKIYKNIKFACHSAYIQWIVFLDRPVSLRYYYCCSTLSNLVLCVCFYYFFSSSLFHSDPHNFIEKLWNFFFSFCIFFTPNLNTNFHSNWSTSITITQILQSFTFSKRTERKMKIK